MSSSIAAWAERARPQIHNRCFQSNRPRESLCENSDTESPETNQSSPPRTRHERRGAHHNDESGSQPTGDGHLCPKAISIAALLISSPIAAWAERARPQIHNRCFQSNRAREQADTVERSGVPSAASQEGLFQARRGFILGARRASPGWESSIRLRSRAVL